MQLKQVDAPADDLIEALRERHPDLAFDYRAQTETRYYPDPRAIKESIRHRARKPRSPRGLRGMTRRKARDFDRDALAARVESALIRDAVTESVLDRGAL